MPSHQLQQQWHALSDPETGEQERQEQQVTTTSVAIGGVVGEEHQQMAGVEVQRRHFPCCVVWCNLGLFTWAFPLVGHCGVSTSEGVITDFAGPFFVHTSRHSLAFGLPLKYLVRSLSPTQSYKRSLFVSKASASRIGLKKFETRLQTT